jgi:hypothetical protein
MIILVIGLILFYFMCAISMYFYNKIAYSKGGIWENIEPDITDIFIVITPFCNFLAVCYTWLGQSPRKRKKDKVKKVNFAKKFFSIKKSTDSDKSKSIQEKRDETLEIILHKNWIQRILKFDS